MFTRPHHQRIAKVLESLDTDLLKRHNCLFAGGTAIALGYGEYRESVDIDFLVSDLVSYRYLRNSVREQGLQVLMKSTDASQLQTSDIRSDQYGIRTKVFVEGKPIKFEIVLEGRHIELIVVDFPIPFLPSKATTCPLSISRVTSNSAWLAPYHDLSDFISKSKLIKLHNLNKHHVLKRLI